MRCYTREDVEEQMAAQLREEYATTNEAMLKRLRLICDELEHYAFKRQENGERFQDWRLTMEAYVAMEWLFPVEKEGE